MWEENLRTLSILRASWSPGRVKQHSMRFGEHSQQRVIAFIPKEPQPGPWVYFLFGGGWSSGSARLWSFAGNWFARHGIPAVLGGYRLAPAHQFPEPLEDVRAGFAFALAHADELGIEGRDAVLSGASSGGHLATLAAIELARSQAASNAAGASPRVAGLLLVNAAVDLHRADTPGTEAAIEAHTGHKRPWPEADPLTWMLTEPPLAGAIPPTLLVQGTTDELVAPAGAESLADTINALAPGRAEVLRPPWQGHNDLTRLFLDKDPQLTGTVMDWLRTHHRRMT